VSTKILNKDQFSKRSLSRLIASQTFYQYDFYQRQIEVDVLAKQLIENYSLDESEELSSYLKKVDNELLQSLLSGLILVIDKIDEEVELFLKDEQNITNLSDIMLQILRLATFEIKFMKDNPTKVIINEYVDLAACFYDSRQVTFANSVLQNIANKNRPDKKLLTKI